MLALSVKILPLLCISLLSACDNKESKKDLSEIYLVRHFEKQDANGISQQDPVLTEQGFANARALANHLLSKHITKIYSTDYKRTRQTAMPLSKDLGISITSYKPSELKTFSQLLLTQHSNLLVVGHSNTTGQLFGLLGCESTQLTEQDYGDVFVVKVNKNDANKLVECASYTLPQLSNMDLIWVKQNNLHQYWQQSNKQFTFNAPDDTQATQSGWVEVGFTIDPQGRTSDYEIVASEPVGLWHKQAMRAAQQLHFIKGSAKQNSPKIYTTWLFRFKAP